MLTTTATSPFTVSSPSSANAFATERCCASKSSSDLTEFFLLFNQEKNLSSSFVGEEGMGAYTSHEIHHAATNINEGIPTTISSTAALTYQKDGRAGEEQRQQTRPATPVLTYDIVYKNALAAAAAAKIAERNASRLRRRKQRTVTTGGTGAVQPLQQPLQQQLQRFLSEASPAATPPTSPSASSSSCANSDDDVNDSSSDYNSNHQQQQPQVQALTPFAHQVDGHTTLLAVDSTTVCKPLIQRELFFYQHAPAQLRLQQFLNVFKGILNVKFVRHSNGQITFFTTTTTATQPSTATSKKFHRRRRLSRTKSMYARRKTLPHSPCSPSPQAVTQTVLPSSPRLLSSSQHDIPKTTSVPANLLFLVNHDALMNYSSSSPSENLSPSIIPLSHSPTEQQSVFSSAQTAQPAARPWSVQCIAKTIEKLEHDNVNDFLLLQNAISNYRRPCIIDLKMGFQQYGDDASDDKKLAHAEKCATTTSSTLGVRACGMQTFCYATGGGVGQQPHYVSCDKYYGRSLNASGFQHLLYTFLHNGIRLRCELIPHIVERLQRLRAIVAELDGYRFFSSSLLLMYEGDDILATNYGTTTSSSTAQRRHSVQSSALTTTIKREVPSNNNCYYKVDVKMIDFAHTTIPTTSSSNNNIADQQQQQQRYNGPDTGYLLGLENLIEIFNKFACY